MSKNGRGGRVYIEKIVRKTRVGMREVERGVLVSVLLRDSVCISRMP